MILLCHVGNEMPVMLKNEMPVMLRHEASRCNKVGERISKRLTALVSKSIKLNNLGFKRNRNISQLIGRSFVPQHDSLRGMLSLAQKK